MYTNMDTSQTAPRFSTEGHSSCGRRAMHVSTNMDTAGRLEMEGHIRCGRNWNGSAHIIQEIRVLASIRKNKTEFDSIVQPLEMSYIKQ